MINLAENLDSSDNYELFIKTGTRYQKLKILDLMFVKTEGKYIGLYFKDGKRLLRISLANFLNQAIPIKLIRVHKCFAINTAFITSHRPDEIMIMEHQIPIGKQYKENWLNYLKTQDTSFGSNSFE